MTIQGFLSAIASLALPGQVQRAKHFWPSTCCEVLRMGVGKQEFPSLELVGLLTVVTS